MTKKPQKPVEKIAKPTKAAEPRSAKKLEKKPSALLAPAPTKESASSPAKQKRIHGSFSMPASDYALIAELKATLKKGGRPVKKNELLRAGLHALKSMNDAALQSTLSALKPVKTTQRSKSK
ncbi:MAG: hypothetical protein SGI99_12360 [Pseudomonadota bacterium]|nr:hypothetical protein [Pseudomonadota bacterium]